MVAFLVVRARESTGGDGESFIRQNDGTRGRIRIILLQSADTLLLILLLLLLLLSQNVTVQPTVGFSIVLEIMV